MVDIIMNWGIVEITTQFFNSLLWQCYKFAIVLVLKYKSMVNNKRK